MILKKRIQQEYFQRPQQKGYKECNRYKISNITLENFGLEIGQGKLELPETWSNDRMITIAPKNEIKEDGDKPFCCTHCGSENYIKYGKKNGEQVYKCKVCNRKFVDNLFFEGMKADPKIICLTLDLYFKGCSLRKISDHLKQFYNLDVCFTTVYRWIVRYIEAMDTYVSQFKPHLGDTWNTDEMMISVNGNWYYLWNIIDAETRFHLASVISKDRKMKDARRVFKQAKMVSHNQKPKYIVTDGLRSYPGAVKKEFYTVKRETVHLGNVPIRGRHYKDMNKNFDNNMVERLHGTIRERNKTQRGLEIPESVFIKGHRLYYNFMRPHQSLDGKSPSEMAGITIEGSNKWFTLIKKSVQHQKAKMC